MGETRITKPGATAQPVRAQLPLFFFLDFKRQAEHGIEHLAHGHQGAHARTQPTTWQAGVPSPAPSSRLSQSKSACASPLQQRRQRIAAAGFPARRPASFDTHVRKAREKGGVDCKARAAPKCQRWCSDVIAAIAAHLIAAIAARVIAAIEARPTNLRPRGQPGPRHALPAAVALN
jgi:hypothetical protein